MNKYILFLFLLLSASVAQAQLIDCKVVINAEQTGRSNMSVFKTLENSIKDFVNETRWSTIDDIQNHQKIDCSIFINITEFDGNNFAGNIQVQSSRPIFNSTYTSPVFNFNDEQFSFSYTEHEPLTFDRNSYNSNLTSVLAYYVYTILGLDADTFSPMGGDEFLKEASQVVNVAQQGGAAGWKATDGNKSRYRLNTDLLGSNFKDYRQTLYDYHRLGLDNLVNQPAEAKAAIAASMENLKEMNKRRGNSLLLRVFFDAKAAEIEKIFSAGPIIDSKPLKNTLTDIAPMYSDNWKNIVD